MKKKIKKLITVAIDSPAAAGAGTQAKLIAKHYNLFYLDTGKIYRYIGNLYLQNKKKISYSLINKKIKNLKMNYLQSHALLADKVAVAASIIAKDNKIRKIVYNFQKICAYNPPKKYYGSILDGRDITSIIMKDAMFKFFITASIKIRAIRRFKEYKKLNKKISYKEVLKSLKTRDFSDKRRKYGPLIKTKDSILINTSKLSKTTCFKKIKHIMDRKLKA
jgi:CMP/dCMP kinase